jgi:hypothetical protein
MKTIVTKHGRKRSDTPLNVIWHIFTPGFRLFLYKFKREAEESSMIKFLFLLPVKILGLLFMAIGSMINAAEQRKAEQEKQAARIAREQSARIEKEKRERDRRERIEQADRRRAEKEKAAQAVKAQKAAERRKAETFKADQARSDIEHYKVQRAELLKLYNEIEKQYGDAATDSKKEIAFRKMIALNNQIRGVDRQIEKAQYTINKFGPV